MVGTIAAGRIKLPSKPSQKDIHIGHETNLYAQGPLSSKWSLSGWSSLENAIMAAKLKQNSTNIMSVIFISFLVIGTLL